MPTTTVSQVGEAQRLVSWIIKADLEIQQKHSDWKFHWGQDDFDTANGTATYDDPVAGGVSTFDEDSFYLDSTSRISCVYYESVKGFARPTGTSQPSQVVIMPNGKLRCDPTPNGVYTISFDYWMKPVAMALNTDVSIIPEEFHDVILGKALMHYAEYENAAETMQKGQRMYADWILPLESKQLPGDRNQHRQAEGNEYVVRVE
jgi:hypothetical protein